MIHLILNNGVNESVGGQMSAGYLIDLTKIAESCGYRTPGRFLETKEELQAFLKSLPKEEMPVLVDIHVRQGIRPDMPKLSIDRKAQKVALMRQLKK